MELHEARGLLSAYIFGHLVVCSDSEEKMLRIKASIERLVDDVVEAAVADALDADADRAPVIDAESRMHALGYGTASR